MAPVQTCYLGWRAACRAAQGGPLCKRKLKDFQKPLLEGRVEYDNNSYPPLYRIRSFPPQDMIAALPAADLYMACFNQACPSRRQCGAAAMPIRAPHPVGGARSC